MEVRPLLDGLAAAHDVDIDRVTARQGLQRMPAQHGLGRCHGQDKIRVGGTEAIGDRRALLKAHQCGQVLRAGVQQPDAGLSGLGQAWEQRRAEVGAAGIVLDGGVGQGSALPSFERAVAVPCRNEASRVGDHLLMQAGVTGVQIALGVVGGLPGDGITADLVNRPRPRHPQRRTAVVEARLR